MKKIFALIIFLNSVSAFGQGFISMDTIKNIPPPIKQLISGKIIKSFLVDFTGDNKKDYICQIGSNDQTQSYFTEYWISSEFKTLKMVKKYEMDFNYFWLVNIDNDKEPEIFSATGYEDGIDYAFYDQDLIKGKDSILFYFNPVIIEEEKRYWGYPWDISNIIIKIEGNKIYLKSSTEHDINNDGEITIPKDQNQLPVIFFIGDSTQPDVSIADIRKINFKTLNELMNEIK